jgi:hypothetical protein
MMSGLAVDGCDDHLIVVGIARHHARHALLVAFTHPS